MQVGAQACPGQYEVPVTVRGHLGTAALRLTSGSECPASGDSDSRARFKLGLWCLPAAFKLARTWWQFVLAARVRGRQRQDPRPACSLAGQGRGLLQ